MQYILILLLGFIIGCAIYGVWQDEKNKDEQAQIAKERLKKLLKSEE
jgi:hypothetical protein